VRSALDFDSDWDPANVVDQISRDEVLHRWQQAVDETWAPYAKYTLVAALDRAPLPTGGAPRGEDVARVDAAAWRLAGQGLPADTMWVVDLGGAQSVAFGTWLSRNAKESVSLIPTFNNWPAKNEMVPAQQTMGAMATLLPLPVDGTRGPSVPVFLLDSWRLAFASDEVAEDAFDNRYALGITDLPRADELRARGIRRIVYLVESKDDTPAEGEDLHEAFSAYRQAGIELAIADLGDLASLAEEDDPPGAPPWTSFFSFHAFTVSPRVTILQQHHFYVRSHGGFGGIHAAPHVIASGVRVGHGGGSHGGFGGGHGGHGGGG
jgi:hypothetical protein